MAIYVSEGAKNFTPAPPGLHQAVCIDVVDLGLQEKTYGDKHKLVQVVRIMWALDEIDPENGEPFRVMRQFNASLHKKATLRAFLETWRGRPFTSAELERFDLENLLGVNAQVQVIHNKVEDRTYANVASAVALGKGMAEIAGPADYVRVKDRVEVVDRDDAPNDDDERVPF